MKLYNGYTLEQIIESGNEKKARFEFSEYKPDILGEVFYFKDTDDSRESPATSGYRPAHQVTTEYQTSGEHIYFENDVAFPGDTVQAYIKFITPEAYPHCLWVGKTMNINEGSRVVGTVTVKEVFNELLETVNKN